MNLEERSTRLRRISELASEDSGCTITPQMVEAVDRARRAEYFERLEEAVGREQEKREAGKGGR